MELMYNKPRIEKAAKEKHHSRKTGKLFFFNPDGEIYEERFFALDKTGTMLFKFKSTDQTDLEAIYFLPYSSFKVKPDKENSDYSSWALDFGGSDELILALTKTDPEIQAWHEQFRNLTDATDIGTAPSSSSSSADPSENPQKLVETVIYSSSSTHVPADIFEESKLDSKDYCLAVKVFGLKPDNQYQIIVSSSDSESEMSKHPNSDSDEEKKLIADQTEVVQVLKSNEETEFYHTIQIRQPESVTNYFLRFAVYMVEDLEEGKSTLLGSCHFNLASLVQFINKDMTEPLKLFKERGEGRYYRVSVRAVQTPPNELLCTVPPLLNCPLITLRFQRNSKTYFFPNSDPNLHANVKEVILESPFSFCVPYKFFRLLEEQEKKLIQLFAKDNKELLGQEIREKLIHYHQDLMAFDRQQSKGLELFRDRSFRASVYKKEENLQPVPINCHTYLMILNFPNQEEYSQTKNKMYGIVTFGAAAEYREGFKKGGARKLLQGYMPSLRKRSLSTSRKGCVYMEEMTCDTPGPLSLETHLVYEPPFTTINSIFEGNRKFSEASQQLQGQLLALTTNDPEINAAEKIINSLLPETEALIKVIEDAGPSEKVTKLLQMIKQVLYEGLKNYYQLLRETIQNAKTTRQATIKDQTLQTIRELSDKLFKQMNALVNAHLGEMISQHISTLMPISLRKRLDNIMSQALAALVTAFALTLNTNIYERANPDERNSFCFQLEKIGYLAEFESLLSTQGDEEGMIEDFMIAIESLKRVSFKLKMEEREASITATFQKGTDLSNTKPFPISMEGNRDALTVIIYIERSRFALLTSGLREGKLIKVVPLMFSQGINETQTVSNIMNKSGLQDEINDHYTEILVQYVQIYLKELQDKFAVDFPYISSRLQELQKVLKDNKKDKKVQILALASKLARSMNGGRLTSCKSAKDRTSMSTTLEFYNILQENFGLFKEVKDKDPNPPLNVIRSQGVRRENAYKNTGIKKYAFNALQAMTLPKEYRPPKESRGDAAA